MSIFTCAAALVRTGEPPLGGSRVLTGLEGFWSLKWTEAASEYLSECVEGY